ncbi:MAG: class I SAM-dependent methyltransferase [Anaerolineales bacterium]|nr:class I SAM-dependent methyltransferase [Anaerolineales bacterium]
MNLRQLFFDFQYRFSKPPWDSNVTPPEVVAFAEKTFEVSKTSKVLLRALDLGCGTGTNSIYLAQHGFAVVGVDFSAKAIATARAKARRANLAIDFHVADVTRLDTLRVREPFDFVLDIGCLHAVDATRRARYAEQIARVTRPGAMFMLYAFGPRPPDAPRHWLRLRNVGIAPDEVRALFTPPFVLERVAHGTERGERASAWYWFKKTVGSQQ